MSCDYVIAVKSYSLVSVHDVGRVYKQQSLSFCVYSLSHWQIWKVCYNTSGETHVMLHLHISTH